ncbi:helicase associated domain-containing protein [Streptomyces sp. NPDC055722]
MTPAERPAAAPAAKGAGKALGKASAAFQRGVAALAQYIAREGDHRVPRGHSEEIAVEGEAAPVVVKLGVWVSNTKSRRDKLTPQQRAELAELGVEWA